MPFLGLGDELLNSNKKRVCLRESYIVAQNRGNGGIMGEMDDHVGPIETPRLADHTEQDVLVGTIKG